MEQETNPTAVKRFKAFYLVYAYMMRYTRAFFAYPMFFMIIGIALFAVAQVSFLQMDVASAQRTFIGFLGVCYLLGLAQGIYEDRKYIRGKYQQAKELVKG